MVEFVTVFLIALKAGLKKRHAPDNILRQDIRRQFNIFELKDIVN